MGTQSTNAGVTSNSNSFRMRLYFVDLRKGKWELLGGQSWSMMTPGRVGISPLPRDIFYSQDMDTNYQVGLPGPALPSSAPSIIRATSSPSDSPWSRPNNMAAAPPAAARSFCRACWPRLTPTPRSISAPRHSRRRTCTPDFQAKLAFDPMVNGNLMHFEFGGVLSSFKTYNPATSQHFTKHGRGRRSQLQPGAGEELPPDRQHLPERRRRPVPLRLTRPT